MGPLHLSCHRSARGLPLPGPHGAALERCGRVDDRRDRSAPLDHIGETMRQYPPVDLPGLPRFTGGAVGYIGYDVVRSLERLPHPPPDDRDLPDAILMVADTLLVLDNLFNRATIIANVEVTAGMPPGRRSSGSTASGARIEEWLARLEAPCNLRAADASKGRRRCRPPPPPMPTGSSRRDVRKILEYIAAGDTFQTVLSRRLDLAGARPLPDLSLPPGPESRAVSLLPALRRPPRRRQLARGAGPGGGRRGDGSPDRGHPAAGRPRRKQDQALAAELEADPKERAEHLMLVDLGRNDVGRVAEFGTRAPDGIHGHRALLPRDAPGERGARHASGPGSMRWRRWPPASRPAR